MSDRETVTTVRILGSEYRIRGASPERIAELAAYVDRKFRDLESSSPTVDLKRRAVLVSLNIAEEIFEERARRHTQTQEWQARLERCRERLSDGTRPRVGRSNGSPTNGSSANGSSANGSSANGNSVEDR